MSLDVCTAIPIDVIIAAYEAQGGGSGDGSGGGDGLMYIRMVRMMRLLKLARVLRASRIFRRWQSHFGISFATLGLIKFAILILLTSHWLACAWVLIGNIGVIGATPRVGDEFFGSSWIYDLKLTEADPFELYGVAIFVAFSSITGSDTGKVDPTSPLEYYLLTVASVLGSAVWAYVLSSSCGIIATLNPAVRRVERLPQRAPRRAPARSPPCALVIPPLTLRVACPLRAGAASPTSDGRAQLLRAR